MDDLFQILLDLVAPRTVIDRINLYCRQMDIFLEHIRIGHDADIDENAIKSQFLIQAAGFVVDFDSLQALFPLQGCHLGFQQDFHSPYSAACLSATEYTSGL